MNRVYLSPNSLMFLKEAVAFWEDQAPSSHYENVDPYSPFEVQKQLDALDAEVDTAFLLDRASHITYEDIAARFYGDSEQKRFNYEIYRIARLDTPTPVWRLEVWAKASQPDTAQMLGSSRVHVVYNMYLDKYGTLQLSTWQDMKPQGENKK